VGTRVEVDQGDEQAVEVAIAGEDDVVAGLLGADDGVANVERANALGFSTGTT
jgi:hypothetical protein